jgi:hypothetical protein
MVALLCFLLTLLVSPFKSKNRLEAENAVLRHQLTVPQRKVCGTAIACSSSSCTVGFRRCSRPCRSSGPIPSCAGTEPGRGSARTLSARDCDCRRSRRQRGDKVGRIRRAQSTEKSQKAAMMTGEIICASQKFFTLENFILLF